MLERPWQHTNVVSLCPKQNRALELPSCVKVRDVPAMCLVLDDGGYINPTSFLFFATSSFLSVLSN